jgi:serine/threonine protein kinase
LLQCRVRRSDHDSVRARLRSEAPALRPFGCHLEVKPANFLISAEGVAKIADFGTIEPGDPEAMTKAATMWSDWYAAREGSGHGNQRVHRAQPLLQGIRDLRATMDGADGPNRAQQVEDLAGLKVRLQEKAPNRQSDVFSLGISAVQMFHGAEPSSWPSWAAGARMMTSAPSARGTAHHATGDSRLPTRASRIRNRAGFEEARDVGAREDAGAGGGTRPGLGRGIGDRPGGRRGLGDAAAGRPRGRPGP